LLIRRWLVWVRTIADYQINCCVTRHTLPRSWVLRDYVVERNLLVVLPVNLPQRQPCFLQLLLSFFLEDVRNCRNVDPARAFTDPKVDATFTPNRKASQFWLTPRNHSWLDLVVDLVMSPQTDVWFGSGLPRLLRFHADELWEGRLR